MVALLFITAMGIVAFLIVLAFTLPTILASRSTKERDLLSKPEGQRAPDAKERVLDEIEHLREEIRSQWPQAPGAAS